jgi:hypothetical protein
MERSLLKADYTDNGKICNLISVVRFLRRFLARNENGGWVSWRQQYQIQRTPMKTRRQTGFSKEAATMVFVESAYQVKKEQYADLRRQAAHRQLMLAGQRSILDLVAGHCGRTMAKLGECWPQIRLSPAQAAPSSLSTVRDQ